MTMNYEDLEGMLVLGEGGREVGLVTEIAVDVEDWRLVALEVKVNKDVLEEMGMKRPVFGTRTVRVPISQIARIADVILLKTELPDVEFEEKD